MILTPFQKAAAVVSGGVGTVWEKYTSIDKVMEQNEQLEAELAQLYAVVSPGGLAGRNNPALH